MKPIALIVAMCLLVITGFSQSASLGSPGVNDYSINICADNAGYSYIGGTSGSNALIVKQDPGHNIVWSTQLSFTSNSQYISDIDFIDVVGDTIFGCGYIRQNTTLIGSAYFKLNAQTGAAYWIKSETTSNTYFSCMRYTAGMFMLVGGVITGSGTNDGKVMGVNSQTGQIIWQTQRIGLTFPAYGINYLDDWMSASAIVNGKLFITGRSYVNGATDLNMRVLLIGVDITGNIVLSKYLLFDAAGASAQQNRFYGHRVEYDGADSLVVAYVGDDNCSSCGDFKSGILKCDLQGNVAYARYFDIQGVSSEIVRSFNITPTGYLIYGQVNTGMGDQRLFLLKTNKQGHVLDAILLAPNTGTYTVYAGFGNLGGSNDYVNGIHYFATTYPTSSGTTDIRKIMVDDNLNDLIFCSEYESPNVAETNFIPFSGLLNTAPSPHTVTPQNGTQVVSTLSDMCAGMSIAISHVSDCTSDQITAQVNGSASAQISWSNGSTGTSVTVSTPDTLYVSAVNPDNCCIVTDTIVPVFQGTSGLTMSLPADTVLCLPSGDVFTISPVVQNAIGTLTYNWNTAAASPMLDVSVSGTYWLEVSDNCSTVSDTIQVNITPFPEISYPAVVQSCTTDFPVVLNPVVTNADQYFWEDGSVVLAHSVSAQGIYTITAQNTCGSEVLTIVVQEIPLPQATGGVVDTCIQSGQTIVLLPMYTAVDEISWSTGETTPEIAVSASGPYQVNVSNQCGTDSALYQVAINFFPQLYLPAVLDTCFEPGIGFAYTATGTPGNYVWSTGDLTPDVVILQEGTYTCALTNQCGTVSQSMTVNRLDEVNLFVPADSVIFCSQELPVAELGIETNYDLQLIDEWGAEAWEDLYHSGWYTVLASNACYFAMDSVYVNMQEEFEFYLPNAFTVNGDGINEVYSYKGSNIYIREVNIYNRWGERVYTEYGDFTGWNGDYKGNPCPDGIYQIQVSYEDCREIPVQFNGHVVLLR